MKTHTFKTASFWINNCSVPQTNDMARKKIKFCLSWPNKTLEISGRLRNIAVSLTGRTIMSHSNFTLSLNSLVYRMWRHFLLDDPDTKKVPGVAECSPPPLSRIDNIFNPPSKPRCAIFTKSRINRLPVWRIDSKGHDSCRFDRIESNRQHFQPTLKAQMRYIY